MASAVRVLTVYGDPARASEVAASIEAVDDRIQTDTATDYEGAVRALEAPSFDCVVSGNDFRDTSGLDLLAAVRQERPDLPFVLFPETGSETLASEAISAGVTDYVHRQSTPRQYEVLANRILNAVRARRGVRAATTQRNRLERVLSTVPSCVVQLDLDGNFVFANDRAERVLGLDHAALAERSYNDPEWEIRDLDGDPIPDEELPFRRVVATESPIRNVRHKITWPDGTERTLSVSGAPLFEQGELAGVVFSLTDVTEQHHREQRLTDLHEATRDLYAAQTRAEVARITSEAADSVLDFELNGVHLYDESAGGLAPTAVSEAAHEVADEPVTFDHGIAWEAYQTGEVRGYGDVREADEVFNPDTSVRSGLYFPLGEHGVLVINSERVEDFDETDLSMGNVLAANATSALDRVGRQRALESLQRYTSALMNTSPVAETAAIGVEAAEQTLGTDLSGCFLLDDAETRLEAAATTDRLADTCDESAAFERDDGDIGQFLWRVVDDDGPIAARNGDEDTPLPEDSPIQSLLAYPVRDGVFVFGADDPAALGDTDERLCSILVAALSAALERVEREALLRERTERLADQNERLDQFASVVAHDLRNPVQVLRGALTSAGGDDAAADRGMRALDRMETIIDDVLTLARDGTSIDDIEPVSLATVARSSWEVAGDGDADLLVEDRQLLADPNRLRQLLENLYRNSVEHGTASPDTSARRDTPEAADPTITVSVGPLPDGFYVEDDGPGVPPEKRDRIFESGYSDADTGTGFGLAIVYRIADAHGWTVAATEGDGGGLRIEFTGVEVP